MLQKYRSTLVHDAVAGLTGAVAGAPQAMGFAILAGVSPLYGLYAAFITTIATTLFSSSGLLTFAPTNALALVIASTLINYPAAQHLDVLLLLSMLTGVFLLLVGVLRLGSLTQFVSNAVMTGFITGAGILIMLGQLEHMTGYEVESSIPILKFWQWLTHLPQSNTHTFIVGIAAIIIIAVLHETRIKSYATLIAMLILTTLTMTLGWGDVEVVRDMSAIPRGFPAPFIPDFSLAPELVSAAFAMSILAAVQSAALIEATSDKNNAPPNVSRDFIAMGVGNIFGGFFRAMPSCASLSRTAVNVSAGAQTRLSNIFAGAFIGLILIALGGVIEEIPLAVLAGHLVVAAASLIHPRDLRMVWHVNRSARLAMVVTLASTLLLPLQYSIYLGVGLSLLLYIYNSAQGLRVVRIIPDEDGNFRRANVPERLPSNEVVIISVHGNLYFAALRRLEELLPSPEGSSRPVVILRIRENQYFGSTGILLLGRYAEQLQQHGGRFMLSGVAPEIHAEIERANAVDKFGEENIFDAGDIIFNSTRRAYEQAQLWLTQPHPMNERTS